jgi:TIR domain
MNEHYNVFISWAGNRSEHVARYLRHWLPLLVPEAHPWMSHEDIKPGELWKAAIEKQLSGAKVAICCLTPENWNTPWILYEAGALSKAIGDHARVCPYLLAGLKLEELNGPLGLLQPSKADREDTRKLVDKVNRSVSRQPRQERDLDRLFDTFWPELEACLKEMPLVKEPAKRSLEDMVEEILAHTRALNRDGFTGPAHN